MDEGPLRRQSQAHASVLGSGSEAGGCSPGLVYQREGVPGLGNGDPKRRGGQGLHEARAEAPGGEVGAGGAGGWEPGAQGL